MTGAATRLRDLTAMRLARQHIDDKAGPGQAASLPSELQTLLTHRTLANDPLLQARTTHGPTRPRQRT